MSDLLINNTTSTDQTRNRNYDFVFLVKQTQPLKHAIDALSDSIFNPNQDALIQVGSNGCEITVLNIDVDTGNQVFGCLRLKSSGLEDFQCTKPLTKMVSLRGLSCLFRAADAFHHESVVIFVEKGSDRLSFQWGSSSLNFALGRPVSIDLHDVKASYVFPDVSYVFEASTPSKDLRAMMTLLQETYAVKPEYVEVYLRPSMVQLEVDSIVSMKPEEQEEYDECMEWKFWDSLDKASKMADKCSVYLLTEPCNSIMLRFDLQQLGDMVYVTQGQFLDVPDLPCIGHFHSLN